MKVIPALARRARLAAATATLLALPLVAAPAAHAASLGNWDTAQQKAVARAGVLPNLPGGFHGEQPLSAGQLADALTKLASSASTASGAPLQTARVPNSGTISVATFDRLL